MFRIDRVMRGEHYHQARRLLEDPKHGVYSEVDVPELGIRRGDVLTAAYYGNHPRVLGRVRYPRPEQYEPLRELVRRDDARLFPSLSHQYKTNPLLELLSDRRQSGKREKVWQPRIRVVSPIVHAIEQVQATTDDGAWFELLSSVGCRMPAGGAA